MTDFDVAVLGAGPAGSIAATLLARRGHRVAMFDPDPRTSERIGETLPAFAAEMLDRFDLTGPLSDNRHRPITGTISKWGDLRTEDDAVMRPGGRDWRLDRGVFDRGLRKAAVAAGAVHISSLARGITRNARLWTLQDDRENALSAFWLIDATGRRGIIARRYGGSYHRQPSQVAIWSVGERLAASPTAKTLIETQDRGWWYGAVLPSGRPIASFHCSVAQASEIRKRPGIWYGLLGATHVLSDRLSTIAFANKHLRFTDATGTAPHTPAGRNWVACGDAAIAFDPIASQGLLHAIRTGIAGADVISGLITPDTYCREMQNVWRQYQARHGMVRRQAAMA